MAKQNRGLIRWALSAAAQRCNLRTVSSGAAGVATLNRGMLCRHRRGRCHNGEAWMKNPGSCCLFRCKENGTFFLGISESKGKFRKETLLFPASDFFFYYVLDFLLKKPRNNAERCQRQFSF
jgi:hypothetical protein